MIGRHRTQVFALAFLSLALAACSTDDGNDTERNDTDIADTATAADIEAQDATTADGSGDDVMAGDTAADAPTFPVDPDTSPLGGDRPAPVFVPEDYDPGTAWPLVVLLHGYGASAQLQAGYWLLGPQVDRAGFILVTPDGTMDTSGRRFWNATSACCDFGETGVDDVAYILGLVDEAQTRFRVDDGRVFVIGHSNGHFMANRLACEAGDRIRGIAGLAGADYWRADDCESDTPVAILHMHGTDDDTIPFDGRVGAYPGAEEAVARWVERNGCTGEPVVGDPVDLSFDTAGAETTPSDWSDCDAGGRVTFWRMEGVGHIPGLTSTFTPALIDWLLGLPARE